MGDGTARPLADPPLPPAHRQKLRGRGGSVSAGRSVPAARCRTCPATGTRTTIACRRSGQAVHISARGCGPGAAPGRRAIPIYGPGRARSKGSPPPRPAPNRLSVLAVAARGSTPRSLAGNLSIQMLEAPLWHDHIVSISILKRSPLARVYRDSACADDNARAAMRPPNRSASSSALWKWAPAHIRDSEHSSAAAARLGKRRTAIPDAAAWAC